MALLELLAGAAPAWVVAADLLVLLQAARLDDRQRLEHLLVLGARLGQPGGRAAGGRGDRIAALGRVAARVVELGGRGGVAARAPARSCRLLLGLLDRHVHVAAVARELVPDVVH